ncbi:MAG: phosphatidate cytidylyltransferase [Bacteroidales bacterium]
MSILLQRTLSGVVFIVLMLLGLLVHPFGYAGLMLLCVGVMTFEFYRMSLGGWNRTGQLFGFLTCGLLFLTGFAAAGYGAGAARILFFMLPLPLITVWITVLYDKSDDLLKHAAFLFLPLLYISLPFSLFNFMVFHPERGFQGIRLLALFIMLWASDVGGYIIGMTFGQKKGHKLFPRISPKKSWEGFIGSIVFAQLAALVVYFWNPLSLTLMHYVILALIISVLGVFGDLIESVMKRNFGVKDTGTIMPGHGGLLDRFDGALLAFPIAIVYVLWVQQYF